MTTASWFSHYPPGVPQACHAPSLSLWQLLDATVARAPDAPFLVHGSRVITYADLARRAAAAGGAIGAGPHPVILALPNTPDFVAAFFGAMRVGRVAVPVSPDLTDEELRGIVADTEADVVVTAVRAEADALFRDGRVRRMDVPHAAPAAAFPLARDTREDDVAVLQYTSGTTGDRKAAMMTHGNLIANAWQNNAWFAWTADDVIAGALPLYHTWGLSCVMIAAVTAGARIVLFEDMNPARLVRDIHAEGVSVLYGSATLFDRLLDAAAGRAAEAFGRCRYVKAGAMLVGNRLPDRWRGAVPAVPMELGYGLTEASPEVCDNPPHRWKPGTVGVPLPGTEVRIADPADPGVVCAVDTVGEVQVRGPQVTRGYWRRPDATAATILPDGWLRTGDLGRLDEEGYLTIVDRLKDLIKFRGWSVVPAEVEAALRQHPLVRDVVVVGRPHAVDGEEPVACIVPQTGSALDGEDLDAFLTDRLARFKRPRRYVFVSDIPRNAVGKPLRRELRARLADAG